MANMITGIISLTIGAVLMASVFINTIKGVNQTACTNNTNTCSAAWTSSEIAMWGLLTLLGIVGLLYGVLNVFGLA